LRYIDLAIGRIDAVGEAIANRRTTPRRAARELRGIIRGPLQAARTRVALDTDVPPRLLRRLADDVIAERGLDVATE